MIKNSVGSVLILGASGMLGSTLFRTFCLDDRYDVFGTVRNFSDIHYFKNRYKDRLLPNIDLEDETVLPRVLAQVKPHTVINCVGMVKQKENSSDYIKNISLNALLPHRVLRSCSMVGARLIHISSDCVFSGLQGNYNESQSPDPVDLYGRTKLLGEVTSENAITIRTSIVGHELHTKHGLVEWFLNETSEVKGYTKAIFSGLPTIEVSRVLRELIIPNPDLFGLYHLSSDPISKYDFLKIVAEVYQIDISIVPDSSVSIDRSLNSGKLRSVLNYKPKKWYNLIGDMYDDYQIFD